MNPGFAAMFGVALRVGLLLGCLVPSAVAQCMKWVLRTDVADPGPQVGHSMAYHSDRQRVVVFTSDVAADLWEYDGFQWSRVSVTGPRPSPRNDSAMAYDRARQELVLVGGFGRSENTELADTWTCRLTTDAAGHVLGSWTRRADFPDHASPDEDDPAGQMGESGARTEHSLVYDESRQVVRLFGGKARIIRGSKWQRPYNRENYSAGNGTWTGSAWVDRQWRNPRAITTPDPEHVPVIGVLHFRHELGRKLIASTYDARRQRTVTFGGLRQIYQSRDKDSLAGTRVDEAYIESLPHLQYFVESGALGSQNFPSPSRQILHHSQGRCGYDDTERIFGAQLVHDTWRDRYVAFGGGFVTGEGSGGVPCAPFYGVDTSAYRSQLVSESFREWDPRRPSPPDSVGNVRLPLIDRGGAVLPTPPASRIRHTMVFDEHRGVTVMYGGWDGTVPSLETVARQTWEYAPNDVGFAEEPAALNELCLGEPMTLKVRPLSALEPTFQWFRGRTALADATNATLMVPSVTPAEAGTYFCEVTDPCGNSVASRPAVVRVGGPPTIVGQPSSVHVCPGDEASTTFLFDSGYPATVRWFRLMPDSRGEASLSAIVEVPGAGSNGIRFPSMRPADNGFYRARVTNRCGTAWTDIIELTAGVWFKLQPSSSTNEVCSSKALVVAASGKGVLRYRWRRNGEVMAVPDRVLGTDAAQLAFPALRYLDDAAYDCVVTDECDSVASGVANVTVEPNPPFLLADTNGPPARQRHGMVYDPARGVSVLFGGLGNGQTVAAVYRNDTWEYDGTNWAQRFPAHSPSSRADFAMAFDRDRSRVVLFGGATNNETTGGYHNGETWEYDSTDWIRRFPARSPAPRLNGALFYDPVRRVTTLYGGDTALANPRAGDIWTWDGTDWTQKAVVGERPVFGGTYGSPARPRMVWDERRGYAVLPPTSRNQGGPADYTTWTWNGTNWTAHPYAFTGFGNSPASAGGGVGMVYDRFRGEVIYWGGDGYDQAFVWRWNGDSWRRDDIAEFVGFQIDPATAYDERRDSVVMFGGSYSGSDVAARGLSRRTFERVLADGPVLLRQTTVVDDPATNRLFLRIVAAGAPPLRYEWQRNGVKLAEGFPYSGITNATLVVDRAIAGDAGRYRCIVRGRCGEVASLGTTLAGIVVADVALSASSGPVAGRPGITLSWTAVGVVLEQAPAAAGPWSDVQGAVSPFTPPFDRSAGFFRLSSP